MQGGILNEDMQSYVDRDLAAGAVGDEAVDSLVPVSDGDFERVIVDCVLVAGDAGALVSIFLIPMKSALILLVSAWLISPAGLPLIAQKLLEVLYAGCERMQDWVMG